MGAGGSFSLFLIHGRPQEGGGGGGGGGGGHGPLLRY